MLPISGPEIEDGAVVVRGSRIVEVGRTKQVARPTGSKLVDLGDSILLPGLVNAHCHLDYTAMAGHLAPRDLFTDWLKLITELKSGWDGSDYASSWRLGAEMLLRTGCTTVGDIEAVFDLLPGAWNSTPLRVVSFLEMIGITARRSPDMILTELEAKLSSLKSRRCSAGLSPHAPYSTVPELLKRSALFARRKRLRVCIHLAESELEYRMFSRGRGEMFEWMKRSGRDMSDCGKGSPVQHAARCGLLNDRLLAVHVNYLAPGDARLLGDAGAHVVHCPRSHAYFEHDRFPLKALKQAGVNVCLGTDSLASVWKSRRQQVQLSMFDEMQVLLKARRDIRPAHALEMSTTAAARALGLAGKVGELAPGAYADLIAVSAEGVGRKSTEAAVLHQGDVSASMIHGAWVVPPLAGK